MGLLMDLSKKSYDEIRSKTTPFFSFLPFLRRLRVLFYKICLIGHSLILVDPEIKCNLTYLRY